MGTPSKIGNEYNVVINGTADWDNTFVKFVNFSAAGPSGTTTVQSSASLLSNFNSTITSINSLLKSGSYVNGVLTFNTALRTIRVYGPVDYSGDVVANKIEIIVNDPAVGALEKTTLTGRVVINPISFKIGNGDSISNITLTYASNADGVSRVGSIDTSLTYDSKDQLYGKINNYITTSIENEGDLTGYAYQSKYSFTGVDVAASVVDRLTYWSDEKIYFDYTKGYDSKGVVIYSRTVTPAKGLPLETDSGLFTSTLLNGNTYVVINGSNSAPVSSYGGDDYILDNSSGSNRIYGGDGTDIVEYQDASTNYTAVKITDTSFQLIKNNIVKTLNDIEQLKFSDKTVIVNTLFLVSNTVNVSGKSLTQSVKNENHKLTVIVDKGILGLEAVLLKGLSESITLTDGIETKHTVQYGNSVFNYSQIDALITTVTRDDEFTTEFTKEINDYLKTDANITYKVAVGLVGAANIDAILMTVAGSDGNYVG